MADIVPQGLQKKLRACMLCSLVKTQVAFTQDGCENCEEVLHYKGDSERVAECTSGTFEGAIALMKPTQSWTARWQRIDKFTKGIYAVQITGKLPIEVQESLLDKGIKYRPRDVIKMKVSKKELFESHDPAILKTLAFQQLDKKQQRLIKNRLSADASRKRKKEQFDILANKADSLEKENVILKQRVDELLLKNQELQEMVVYLSSVSSTMPSTEPLVAPLNCIGSPISGKEDFVMLRGLPDFVVEHSPVPSSTLNGSTLSNHSSAGEENEEDLGNRMLADFVDLDGDDNGEKHGMLAASFKSIFSMFLFTFAAFLPASLHFQHHHSFLSSIPSSSLHGFGAPDPQVPYFPSLSHISSQDTESVLSSTLSESKDDWHLRGGVHVKSSSLPLEPQLFLDSLSVLSKINPPNAVFGIEGLFRSNSLDVKLALVPSTPLSSSAGFSKEFTLDSSLCINQASLMVDPRIRIAPFTEYYTSSIQDKETQSHQQQKLRLSLFADIPGQSGLGIRGDGGILRLDLQVFQATWLQKSE